MRDPRVDPQVGDVVKCSANRRVYTVAKRDGDAVHWRATDEDGGSPFAGGCNINGWTCPDDVVVHVAGEPEAESAVKIHDDRVEMATTIAGLRDDVASLRIKLQAAIIERDSARAELASWNADREEWRAKARAEGPKVGPAELPGWLSRNGWNILNDLPNGSQVWLHTSGLWCRVYDPVEEEDAWRAILTALSAAVDAGATGERVLVVGTRPWAELRVRE
jgi:hypothetical protein